MTLETIAELKDLYAKWQAAYAAWKVVCAEMGDAEEQIRVATEDELQRWRLASGQEHETSKKLLCAILSPHLPTLLDLAERALRAEAASREFPPTALHELRPVGLKPVCVNCGKTNPTGRCPALMTWTLDSPAPHILAAPPPLPDEEPGKCHVGLTVGGTYRGKYEVITTPFFKTETPPTTEIVSQPRLDPACRGVRPGIPFCVIHGEACPPPLPDPPRRWMLIHKSHTPGFTWLRIESWDGQKVALKVPMDLNTFYAERLVGNLTPAQLEEWTVAASVDDADAPYVRGGGE